jgi:hypothetical protein
VEQRLRETGSVTPTTHVNAGHGPQPMKIPWDESREESHDISQENWDYPNRGSSKYYDQLHPYNYWRSAHLFTDHRPLRMQYCEWVRHQHPANELFLRNISWTNKAYSTREFMFKIHKLPQGTGKSSRYPRMWVSSLLQRHRLDSNRRGHCRGPLSDT